MSLTHEAAPAGGSAIYTWSNMKPGSYLYHSGTHMALQVQMGLYGGLSHDSGVNEAYPGVLYDNEAVLFYSEIDPALHDAVAAGTYGTAGGPTSTYEYSPKYFLINGEPFVDLVTAPVPTGYVDERTLLRFFSASLESHIPTLNGPYVSIVAEDGNPYRFPRNEYSLDLAPGKTRDAVFMPTAVADYALYDRALALTNNTASPGGMFRYLQVMAGSSASDKVNIVKTLYDATLEQLSLWATSSAAPGAVLTTVGIGALPSSPGTGFDYMGVYSPTPHPGSVTVSSDQGGSDTKPVPFISSPVANNDTYSVDEGGTLIVPAAGLLANDSRGGYVLPVHEMRSAPGAVVPVNGALSAFGTDGSFTYVHDGSETTGDNFTYLANAVDTGTQTVLESSREGIVVITINPVNDAPVAVDDAANTENNTAIVINVLANDTDAEHDPLSVNSFTQGTAGTVTSSGASMIYTPTGAAPFVDSFTYTSTDGKDQSGPATVTVTVESAPNRAPVAVDDVLVAIKNVADQTLNILANDRDDGVPLDPSLFLDPPGPPDDPTMGSVRIWGARARDADGKLLPKLNGYPVKQTSRGGTVVFDPASRQALYRPPVNFVGTDIFRYGLIDAQGRISAKAAKVRVNVVNP